MTVRSKVDLLLPPRIKDELNDALAARAFSGYEDLAEWLQEQGYEISKSSLQRYGVRYERQLNMLRAATDTAQRLVDAAPDNKSALAQATVQLAQERLFDLLLASEECDPAKLQAACGAIAKLAQSQGSIEKHRREAKAEARAEAAEAAGKAARKRGLSAEAERAIRAAVEGKQ